MKRITSAVVLAVLTGLGLVPTWSSSSMETRASGSQDQPVLASTLDWRFVPGPDGISKVVTTAWSNQSFDIGRRLASQTR